MNYDKKKNSAEIQTDWCLMTGLATERSNVPITYYKEFESTHNVYDPGGVLGQRIKNNTDDRSVAANAPPIHHARPYTNIEYF